MRGLTLAEEDALRLVAESETGAEHLDCRACKDVRRGRSGPDYSMDDSIFDALFSRGLLHVERCRVEAGALHCTLTSAGRLALRLAAATRSSAA